MKQEIQAFDYAGEILKALPGGVLVTTKSGETVNTMTIGWGTLGIEWGKPIFIAYVRDSRFTKALLEQNPEFTVNIPFGEVDRKILSICGTKSGRELDKIEALGLTLEEPAQISVPGIKELPLTLECKILYTQKQDETVIPDEIKRRYYPQDDYHTAFYGEIVGAYLIK